MRKQSFLLVSDSAEALRLRRFIAERSPRIDLLVGTWPELLCAARRAYLLCEPQDRWTEKLRTALREVDGFWTRSLEAAFEETASCVGQALRELLEAVGPHQDLPLSSGEGLLPRARRHYDDLVRLHRSIEGVLPLRLEGIRQLLAIPPSEADYHLCVHPSPHVPPPNRWERSLLEKLAADAGGLTDPSLLDLLANFGTGAPPSGKSLRALQTHLFSADTTPVALEASVQFWAVRDPVEEAEIAAGAIQKLLGDNPDLNSSEIGLLIPDDDIYRQAVREAFGFAGLPLSGMPAQIPVRDLGYEALLHFLICRQGPAAPVMALASLLSSPLMPWSAGEGLDLAQQVMDGSFSLKSSTTAGERILQLIRKRKEPSPAQLAVEVRQFVDLLAPPEGMEDHRTRAREGGAALGQILSSSEAVPWPDLLRLVSPRPLTVPGEGGLWREGIAVWSEGSHPWRPVRRLFVLGFSDGHYPADPPRSIVFSEADRRALRHSLGLRMETAEEQIARRRLVFLEQLRACSEGVIFLVPRRTLLGESVAPSTSLYFAAQLFGCGSSPESLLLELDTEEGRRKARGLSITAEACPIPPRALAVSDLDLGCNLLHVRVDGDGKPLPQSPSRLENLMVSPLTWLLDSAGLTPREWTPQTLDVALRGTLAHRVFEGIFRPDRELPDLAQLRQEIPGLLREAILREGPFLLGPEWKVECRHLEAEIRRAAEHWYALLNEMQARVLATEIRLDGMLDDVPIRGYADVVLALPDGRVLVADYKKSKTSKRRQRMQNGFDSQATLYRIMLESGNSSLEGITVEKGRVGVLYYLMNDQGTLTDTAGWVPRTVAGVEELGDGISRTAMTLIRERISEVRGGRVCLNTETDPRNYDALGVPLYCLDTSPLVSLFMHPAPEEGE